MCAYIHVYREKESVLLLFKLLKLDFLAAIVSIYSNEETRLLLIYLLSFILGIKSQRKLLSLTSPLVSSPFLAILLKQQLQLLLKPELCCFNYIGIVPWVSALTKTDSNACLVEGLLELLQTAVGMSGRTRVSEYEFLIDSKCLSKGTESPTLSLKLLSRTGVLFHLGTSFHLLPLTSTCWCSYSASLKLTALPVGMIRLHFHAGQVSAHLLDPESVNTPLRIISRLACRDSIACWSLFLQSPVKHMVEHSVVSSLIQLL